MVTIVAVKGFVVRAPDVFSEANDSLFNMKTQRKNAVKIGCVNEPLETRKR
jgi:hypothetical protein